MQTAHGTRGYASVVVDRVAHLLLADVVAVYGVQTPPLSGHQPPTARVVRNRM
jgi:hypothetical protein